MPTPSPTIAAVGGAQSGTSTTRRRISPSAIAVPRPNTAVISGSPIATADPKVNRRMMAAARSPMPSVPNGAVWDRAATGPPTSTWRVSSPAARMGSTSVLACSGVKSLSRWSRATSAYAVVPSWEICWAPPSSNGLATATTWSLPATSVKIASACAWTSGERNPSSERTTIWMVSPAFCGKLSSRVSAAARDSEPGCR
jgi:hypothetical protein